MQKYKYLLLVIVTIKCIGCAKPSELDEKTPLIAFEKFMPDTLFTDSATNKLEATTQLFLTYKVKDGCIGTRKTSKPNLVITDIFDSVNNQSVALPILSNAKDKEYGSIQVTIYGEKIKNLDTNKVQKRQYDIQLVTTDSFKTEILRTPPIWIIKK